MASRIEEGRGEEEFLPPSSSGALIEERSTNARDESRSARSVTNPRKKEVLSNLDYVVPVYY